MILLLFCSVSLPVPLVKDTDNFNQYRRHYRYRGKTLKNTRFLMKCDTIAQPQTPLSCNTYHSIDKNPPNMVKAAPSIYTAL